jgi:DNA-3-methyladenine glycosylase
VTGNGSGVLLRALEPVKNIEGRTQGPGLLCRSMGIDKSHYGFDLTRDSDLAGDHDLGGPALYVGELPGAPQPAIVSRPRIGVAYARHWARRKLRFYIRGNAFVSKP